MGIKEIFRKEERFLGEPKELPDLASESLNDERNYLEIPKPGNNSSNNNSIAPSLGQSIPNNLHEKAIPNNSFGQNNLGTSVAEGSQTHNSESVLESNASQQSFLQPAQSYTQQHVQQSSQQIPQQTVQNSGVNGVGGMNPGNFSGINHSFSANHPLQGHHPFLGYPVMHQNQGFYYPHQLQPVFFPSANHQAVLPYSSYYEGVNANNPSGDVSVSQRRPLLKLVSELDNLELKWHSLINKKTGLEKEIKYLESEIEHKMKLLRTHLAIANQGNEVDEGDEFYLADGQVLRSRADLEVVAKTMTKQVFDHHVGPGWNDFEAWVANCLHDYQLAKKIRAIKSVDELLSAVKKY